MTHIETQLDKCRVIIHCTSKQETTLIANTSQQMICSNIMASTDGMLRGLNSKWQKSLLAFGLSLSATPLSDASVSRLQQAPSLDANRSDLSDFLADWGVTPRKE